MIARLLPPGFRLPVILGVLLLAASPATAQENSDGSVYSHFGLGMLHNFGSSQIEGMGGAGIGLRSFNYVNFENPAAWSDQILTRATVGITYQGVTISDAEGNTSRLTAGALNAIQFSFPLLSRRLGMALALEPYSRLRSRVQEEGFLTPDPSVSDSVRYLIDHEGRGGLQQVVAGLGYRVHPNLSLGANVSVIFGILEEARQTRFPGRADFEDTDLVTATRLAGVTARFGALFSLNDLLRDEDQFAVGATFTLPATLDGNRVRTLGESLDRDTLGAEITGSVEVPFSAGFGIAYRPDDRWILSADGRYQAWSDFASDFGFPGYTPGGENAFSDHIRTGAGVEFLPAGTDLLAPYFSRVAYRLGFYFDQAYVSPSSEVDIQTLAATGGLSLPTLLPGTHLDINLAVGTRGTTDRGLVRDVFYRLSASVNIGEPWFQRQKLR